MLNRRSFLKRMGAGTAAAVAALRWQAPEKPPDPDPNGSLLKAADERDNFTTVAEVKEIAPLEAPLGWGELRIEGKTHRICELSGPTVTHEVLEDTVYGERIFREGPREATLDMKLWASPECVDHVHDLLKELRKVDAELILPGPAWMHIKFKGYLVGTQVWHDYGKFPTVETNWRLDGETVRWVG